MPVAALASLFGAALPVRAQSTGRAILTDQKVLGRTYTDWDIAASRRYFALPPHHVPCGTGQHGPVWYLGGTGGNKAGQIICTVPASDYVFLGVPSVDCSTVEPPPFYGRTDAQLTRCAKRDWRSSGTPTVAAHVDGILISTAPYIFGTPAFGFSLPRTNALRSPKRHGRAAVYGFSLMLAPLTPGTHTIAITVTHWSYAYATYILHVH